MLRAADGSAIATFNRILSGQQLILRMLGLDVYSRGYTISPLTVGVMALAGFFMVASFYDLLVLFHDDLLGKSFVLTTLFFGIIGWARILQALAYRKLLPGLLQMARYTYVRGVHDAREANILAGYTAILWRGALLYSSIFLVGVVIASVGPVLVFWYGGQRLLPFGVYLPFVNPDASAGYELNYLYQLSCMLWTPPGLCACQNMYFALVLNICIQYDVLLLKLGDLDALILGAEGPSGRDAPAVRAKLRDIITSQQRLERFVNMVEHCFSVMTMVEVLSLSFQIVLTLFVILSNFWLPGILLIPLCTLQLFILCIPGTVIEIKASRLTEAIYSVTWHEMSDQNKRIFALLFHRSQHPTVLTCAGMATINMNLFLNVVKKMYSIFMMLENM